MSAVQTEFPEIVRAVVTEIGIVIGMAGSVTEAVKCRALWDTGAIYSVISKSLADKLGLFPTDTQRAYTAQGFYETSIYRVDIMLPNNMVVKGLQIGDGEFQGFDFLIGMDVISLGDFHLTNDSNTVFKFVIPPEKSPNNSKLKTSLLS